MKITIKGNALLPGRPISEMPYDSFAICVHCGYNYAGSDNFLRQILYREIFGDTCYWVGLGRQTNINDANIRVKFLEPGETIEITSE